MIRLQFYREVEYLTIGHAQPGLVGRGTMTARKDTITITAASVTRHTSASHEAARAASLDQGDG